MLGTLVVVKKWLSAKLMENSVSFTVHTRDEDIIRKEFKMLSFTLIVR